MSLFDDPNTTAPSQGSLIADVLAQMGIDPSNIAPGNMSPAAPVNPQPSPMVIPPGVAPPISTDNYTPPAAPTFGAGATPFQFPQSAAFGAPLPAPAAPVAAPLNANAAAGDDDNDPIAVGNYQMPRIGSGFPDDASPAQPAQQQAPAAPAAAPSPLDTIRSHLDAGAQSMGHGGGLIGGLTALVTGQRHDPQNEANQLKQAELQKQFNAFRAVGATPSEAQIATINPEAAKALVAKYVGKDKTKFVQLKDGLGGDHPAFVNEDAQTINGQSIADYNKQNASNNGSAGLGDMSKTGAEYLATLQPKERGIVQAMVEGRQAPPSSFALGKPYWQNMIAAANNVDPTFDQTSWPARVSGAKDFASGKSSEMVRSANQTLQHVNALLDSADALHNGNYPLVNWAGNKINEATGGGEPGAFITNAHAVADEMSKVFKGGNLSDSEIRAWEENLSPNMSPAQQKAQIGKLAELLHGSLEALQEKRVASIGQAAADKAGPIIKPAGQAVLQRIDNWLKSGATGGNTTKSGVQWSIEK